MQTGRFFVHPDIARAKTLHTDFYTSEILFHAAKEKIFSTTWQLVTNVAQIRKSCFPFSFIEGYINEPLLITKDKDHLNCLTNVCTHRGNIIINEECDASHLRCRYHGRLFNIDGTFRSMPEFREVQDFPSSDDDLHRLPLESWKGFLFTSLKPSINASALLDGIEQKLSWYPFDHLQYRAELSRDYHVNAHWALYCENYLEGFHIPFVHAGLNAVIDYGNYTTELFRYSNLQTGVAKNDEIVFDIPAGHPDHGKKIAAYYFWIFPNMMFNFYPWGLSVNIVRPVSVDQTTVSFLTYMYNESLYDHGAGSNLDKVEMEDEEIVESVQKGIRSQFYQHGRYSVTREKGTHHFHRLVCEFLGGV